MLKIALLLLALWVDGATSMCFRNGTSTEKRREISHPRVVDHYHCKILCAEMAKCLAYQFSHNECTLLGDQLFDFDAICPELYQEWVKKENDADCPDDFPQPQIDAGYIRNSALAKATQVDSAKIQFYPKDGCLSGTIMDVHLPDNSHAIQGERSGIRWDRKLGSWILVIIYRNYAKSTNRTITRYIRAARCFEIVPSMFSDTTSCGGNIPEFAPVHKRRGPVLRYGAQEPCKNRDSLSCHTDYMDDEYGIFSKWISVACIDGAWILFGFEMGLSVIYMAAKITNATCCYE